MFSGRNHQSFSQHQHQQHQQQQQHQYRNVGSSDRMYDQSKNYSSHSHNPGMDTVSQRLWEAAYQGQHRQHRSGGGGGGHHQHQQPMGDAGGVSTGGDQYHTRYGSSGGDAEELGMGYGSSGLHRHQYQQSHMPYHPYQQPMIQPHYGRGVYGGGGGVGGGMMMYDHSRARPVSTIYPQHQQAMYNPYLGYDPMSMPMMNNPYQGGMGIMNPVNMYSGMMPQYGSLPAMMTPVGPYPGPMPLQSMMMGSQYAHYNTTNPLQYGGVISLN